MKKAAILSSGSEEEQAEAQVLTANADKVLANQHHLIFTLEDDEEDWNLWICPYWR